jgi:hypothetical protein
MATFQINGCSQQASVRFKLLGLNSDASRLKLYRTQATHTDGFTYGNDELVAELIERFGPYQEHASMTPYTSGMTNFVTRPLR